MPRPDGAFKVGIDGGYVRNWCAKKHNFEVIVGKSTLSFGEDEADKAPSSKRFGFVQTLDTKPKRRLYEVLHSQGLQMNQDIAFLSDGNDTLRALQLEMSPKATHILDWFHLVRQEVACVIVRHEVNRDRTWCPITSTLGGEAGR